MPTPLTKPLTLPLPLLDELCAGNLELQLSLRKLREQAEPLRRPATDLAQAVADAAERYLESLDSVRDALTEHTIMLVQLCDAAGEA